MARKSVKTRVRTRKMTKTTSTASYVSKQLKKGFSFSMLESCGTYVVAVVSSPFKEENTIKSIDCKGLIPLGNLIYDSEADSYLLDCVDFFCLGTVPINIIGSVVGCPNWVANLPLPEPVIKKFLAPSRRKELREFFSRFDKSFSRSYVQMLDPNV